MRRFDAAGLNTLARVPVEQCMDTGALDADVFPSCIDHVEERAAGLPVPRERIEPALVRTPSPHAITWPPRLPGAATPEARRPGAGEAPDAGNA